MLLTCTCRNPLIALETYLFVTRGPSSTFQRALFEFTCDFTNGTERAVLNDLRDHSTASAPLWVQRTVVGSDPGVQRIVLAALASRRKPDPNCIHARGTAGAGARL